MNVYCMSLAVSLLKIQSGTFSSLISILYNCFFFIISIYIVLSLGITENRYSDLEAADHLSDNRFRV